MLSAAFTKAPDFAIVQHYLDDAPIGGQIDLYGGGVSHMDETQLGSVHLTAGLHVLRCGSLARTPLPATTSMA